MKQVTKLLFCLISFMLVGCGLTRVYTPTRISYEGDYIYKNTEVVFPVNWNEFSRKSIYQFDASASDVGVTYQSKANNDIIVTVYVYPAKNGVENRFRDEFFNSLQAIINSIDLGSNIYPEHEIVTADGYKVIGLRGTINNAKTRTVLLLFECGKYFLKYRISTEYASIDELVDVSKRLVEVFSPIEIVKKQPLQQGATIHIAPIVSADKPSLKAVMSAALRKSKWVYQNVDSLERCAGFPSLYFEEQKVAVDSMLTTWESISHNNSKLDAYFNNLLEIKQSGFMNEYIIDEYMNTLLLPDTLKLNMNGYNAWKENKKDIVKLDQLFYILNYSHSFEK